MHVETTDKGSWIVRVDRGEDVLETLVAFVRERDVPSGEIRGIGAIRDVELGYFDPEEKSYLRTAFPGSMELVSFLGNIAWTDEGPMIHAHAVVAGPDLVARAGHFFGGVVSVSGEFYVTPRGVRVRRSLDTEVELRLMVFEGEK